MQLDIKKIVFSDGTWAFLVEMEKGRDGVWIPKIQKDSHSEHKRFSDVGMDMSGM